MLLMVEKGRRGDICHAVHRYAKENNKDIKNYDLNIILSHLMYLDANNLCGRGISQKLPVNGFQWVKKLLKFNERSYAENIIKNYDENSNKGYILEVDVEYPKNLFHLHSDLLFLAERKKTEKFNKLARSIRDKKKYVVHIRALKQALNHGLILKKHTE